jgi:hypothetical protein
MKRVLESVLVLGFLGVGATSCGGSTTTTGANPLDGTWTYAIHRTVGTLTVSGTLDVTLSSDGTEEETLTPTGICSGTVKFTGVHWTSTATTVSLSGSPTCTGTFTCTLPIVGAQTESCTTLLSYSLAGTCEYALSSNDDSLVLNQCTKSTTPDGGQGTGSGASTSYTLTRSN